MGRTTFRGIASALLIAASAGSALAQGTAFTYQGQLKNTGVAVNTPTDMQFSLWNDATSTNPANQVGSTIQVPALAVSGGLFSTSVDFGVNPYTSNQTLWLQVAVRNPAGSGSYVPMGARQQLTPAPFSLATRGINMDSFGRMSLLPTGPGGNEDSFSLIGTNAGIMGLFGVNKNGATNRMEFSVNESSAVSAGGGTIRMHTPGVGYGNLNLNPTGNTILAESYGSVGIGTATPQRTLHLKGLNPGLMFQDTADTDGANPRWVFDSHGFGALGMSLVRYASGAAQEERSYFFMDNGRFGLGTSNPFVKFHVHGDSFAVNSNAAWGTDVGLFSGGNACVAIVSGSGGTFGANLMLREVNVAGNYINGWSMGRRTTGGAGYLNWTFGDNVDGNGNPIKLTLSTNGDLAAEGVVTGTNIASPSSIRFKQNVVPMSDALDRLLLVQAVRFDWKPEYAKSRRGHEHDFGFIAEELEKVFPEVVIRDESNEVVGVDYARMSAVNAGAVQELKSRLDARLESLEKENAALRARLDRLEAAGEKSVASNTK